LPKTGQASEKAADMGYLKISRAIELDGWENAAVTAPHAGLDHPRIRQFHHLPGYLIEFVRYVKFYISL
jgi:hypothetical protein